MCLADVLLAEEPFVMKEREWQEVYTAPSATGATLPISFDQIAEIAKGGTPDRLTGKTIEIQGYFEAESETSFRVIHDTLPLFEHCASCIKKKERESPQILAPIEAVQKLKPGLVRVRGVAKYRPIALTVEEPVLEIQAERISVPAE